MSAGSPLIFFTRAYSLGLILLLGFFIFWAKFSEAAKRGKGTERKGESSLIRSSKKEGKENG
jgi:hypothetical protein